MTAEDLTGLGEEEVHARIAELQSRMRPLEAEMKELRAQRDVLHTELRRRERLARREQRADLKAQMKEGTFPTVGQLVAEAEEGAFDDFRYNLKTGGEVRLGFPQARAQTLAFTDGRRALQARDLAQAAELFAAGWSLGAPGRAGVRVHFPGTRLERLVDPDEVFVRPA
jgi:TolA-binding protein